MTGRLSVHTDFPGRAHTQGFAAPLPALDAVSVNRSATIFEVRAAKRVRIDDPYMLGHFPGLPIYPGVFILETLRQAVASVAASDGRQPDIRCVRSARFFAPLFPGDLLTIAFTVSAAAGPAAFDVDASCTREDGKSVARLKVLFGIPDE
jgi:3-hydroxyacyl-[acyl-carrier-protein] dehydratase